METTSRRLVHGKNMIRTCRGDGQLYPIAGGQRHLLTVTWLFIGVSGCRRHQERCQIARPRFPEAKSDGKTLPHCLLLTMRYFLTHAETCTAIPRYYLTKPQRKSMSLGAKISALTMRIHILLGQLNLLESLEIEGLGSESLTKLIHLVVVTLNWF